MLWSSNPSALIGKNRDLLTSSHGRGEARTGCDMRSFTPNKPIGGARSQLVEAVLLRGCDALAPYASLTCESRMPTRGREEFFRTSQKAGHNKAVEHYAAKRGEVHRRR
jgi:hypothetical protein